MLLLLLLLSQPSPAYTLLNTPATAMLGMHCSSWHA